MTFSPLLRKSFLFSSPHPGSHMLPPWRPLCPHLLVQRKRQSTCSLCVIISVEMGKRGDKKQFEMSWECYLVFKEHLKLSQRTYTPFPSVCWMRLANVDNQKIRDIRIFPNNLCKVVLEADAERRSATASKVENQRSIPTSKVKQSFLGFAIRRHQLTVRSRQA